MSTSDAERGLSEKLGPARALSAAEIERVVDGELADDMAAGAPTVDVAFVDHPLPD
ncbi:hypothetical protein HQ346_14450 [Rhodococcus sp. BP-252]|uniref:hypothetical protein n=1 Tax=unclassified Rhodococcus (in: high G+C Gram-positive bacteria) TaxID=192944 RepID=UPI001C9AAFBC|nr:MULTISPECIES: hypothetical protein [unclassified Rhodococcus (in: high G+C Gram-positive bacteria)]MBY6412883.1 hypothetical protein [Rhodococcus sp. BP-320]MBY6417580.1 hypothetical protein [Rhodococcus sp. BP-321]MBY6423048.1 hypothetical protein [Rhodococcus sp. BP-324]MBY6427604.1 hypothetical protein [Rhodococcus sp. BP-323]MBY6432768.1 hypothetical protein [Rhodococcus sp. BP-322]